MVWPDPGLTMKTFIQLLVATIIVFAGGILAGNRSFTLAGLVAGLFSVALLVWTLRQYERPFPPLAKARPLHVPVDRPQDPAESRPGRAA